MSDKLKVMQNHVSGDEVREAQEMNLRCASIGYPDLRSVPQKGNSARSHGCDQPEIDESEFDRLVGAADESRLIA